MKRVLTAVLLCLLVLLCGCMRQPEAEPPAQEAVSVSPVPVQENDPASVEQKTEAQDPVSIPDGIVKINGLAIYYQNGQHRSDGTGRTASLCPAGRQPVLLFARRQPLRRYAVLSDG